MWPLNFRSIEAERMGMNTCIAYLYGVLDNASNRVLFLRGLNKQEGIAH